MTEAGKYLNEHQWNLTVPYCNSCYSYERNGHAETCELAAILKEEFFAVKYAVPRERILGDAEPPLVVGHSTVTMNCSCGDRFSESGPYVEVRANSDAWRHLHSHGNVTRQDVP